LYFVRTAKLGTDFTTQCIQRSIEDITSRTLLVARSPVHVGDPVDVLVLTQTFWNGLDYHVTFTDNEQPRLINSSTAVNNGSLPVWITQDQFVSSTESLDAIRQLMSTQRLIWIAMAHRYPSSGSHVIKLLVSGHVTLRGPIQQAEFAVSVVVRDVPSLGDVIGHVTLASLSQPAYVNESVTFVYAVEKFVQDVIYHVHFENEPEATVRQMFILVLYFVWH